MTKEELRKMMCQHFGEHFRDDRLDLDSIRLFDLLDFILALEEKIAGFIPSGQLQPCHLANLESVYTLVCA